MRARIFGTIVVLFYATQNGRIRTPVVPSQADAIRKFTRRISLTYNLYDIPHANTELIDGDFMVLG
jgi:hypothetical protein